MLGNPNKICSYVVRVDSGAAPNPFWGCCTLAICTPNHQRADLHKGDWIVGTTPKDFGSKFLYLMELEEKPLSLDQYFVDPRFEQKKPQLKPEDDQRERVCGDNFYRLVNGSLEHTGAASPICSRLEARR